jgi:hypothetical protein
VKTGPADTCSRSIAVGAGLMVGAEIGFVLMIARVCALAIRRRHELRSAV